MNTRRLHLILALAAVAVCATVVSRTAAAAPRSIAVTLPGANLAPWQGLVAQFAAATFVLGSYVGAEALRKHRRARILAMPVA